MYVYMFQLYIIFYFYILLGAIIAILYIFWAIMSSEHIGFVMLYLI